MESTTEIAPKFYSILFFDKLSGYIKSWIMALKLYNITQTMRKIKPAVVILHEGTRSVGNNL